MSYQLRIIYDNGDPEKIYAGYETVEDAEDSASVVETYPHVINIILESESSK